MFEFPIRTVADGVPNYGVDVTFPVHLEKKLPTMDKKLIINAAPVGALISASQNPSMPFNVEEIARDAIASYKEGAAIFHVHTRVDGAFSFDPLVYKKCMDLVFKECPDMITDLCTVSSFTHEGVEGRMKPMIAPLLEFGHKYSEIAVINPVSNAIGDFIFVATPSGIEEETAYLESVGVKPELAGYTQTAIGVIVEHLIDKGIVKAPYLIDVVAGVHNCTPARPDPEAYVNLIQMIRMLPPNTRWQAIIGGHNWLPLSVFCIMAGCDVVRVGMEDQVHIYPHKDDLIPSAASMVKKIAAIAKELGREIATPDEARKILGLPKP